jgi:choline transport protein
MGIFLVGSLIQTMILVNNENYAFPNWHGTLLACAAMIIAYIGNVYGSRILPYWQIPVFIVHILAYFAFIVPIWVRAPAATHSQVWRDFSNNGGWSSIGLSIMIGQLSGIGQQTGIDTAAHMSEEVKNAAKTIPRTMLSVYAINMCLIFPAIVTIVYHIPDLDAALDDSTTYPVLYVLKQTMTVGWMTALMVVICLITICSNIVYLAAVTRDLFAFSRDKGLPFSKWLSAVHPTRHIPVNAAQFSCVIAFALALIYIGSKLAPFHPFPKKPARSHVPSRPRSLLRHHRALHNLPPPMLLPLHRLRPLAPHRSPLHAPPSGILPRTLGNPDQRSGRAVLTVGFLLGVLAAGSEFLSKFYRLLRSSANATAIQTPVTAEGFNWASPIYVAVLLVSLVYFVARARHRYEGPVAYVEGRKVR